MWYLITVSILIIFFLKVNLPKNELKNKCGIAIVYCRGGSEKKHTLINIKNCAYAIGQFPGFSVCQQGCVNLHSCRLVCPDKALNESLKVNPELCRGCGRCAEVCPRNLIKIEKRDKKVINRCLNTSGLEKIGNMCRFSCRKCYRCLDMCPREAVYVNENGIPETDSSRCNLCGRCTRECPSEARRISFAR